jgi:hypothetical protein
MSKLAEFERLQDLGARYMPIVIAAGYTADAMKTLTPEDAFQLAGTILRDAQVQALVWKDDTYKIFDPQFPAAFDTDILGILRDLGESGRAALRAHINWTVKSR